MIPAWSSVGEILTFMCWKAEQRFPVAAVRLNKADGRYSYGKTFPGNPPGKVLSESRVLRAAMCYNIEKNCGLECGENRMHEMAIAEGILDIAIEYARKNEAKRIVKAALLVGEMAGVECESLTFCWSAIVKGTIAEGASLAITRVPLRGRCDACGEERTIERYNFICPDCGGTLEIISGRELRVDYLEME